MFKQTDNELTAAFYTLSTRQDVASLLEIKESSLRYFLYAKNTEKLYTMFSVPKGKNGTRTIFAPNRELKALQRKLAYVLNLVYTPKSSAYGFVKDRNILLNSQKHIKKRWVLNIDLKDFFTQITFERIMGMLIKKPYEIGRDAAIVIAQLCCMGRILPQGAPTSPVISNMICAPMDTKLIQFAKNNKMSYTRYADDITFSSYSRDISDNVAEGGFENLRLGKQLGEIIKNNGFEVNENKIFLNGADNRQEVTGLVVNKFPNVKREYIKKLRAILHHCEINGVYETAKEYVEKGLCKNVHIKSKLDDKEFVNEWFMSVIKGKLTFLGQIRGYDDLIFMKYAKQANNVFNQTLFDVDEIDVIDANIRKTVIIQTVDKLSQGSGFLLKGYGLMTASHVTQKDDFYNVFSSEYEKIGFLTREENLIKENQEIDYAIFNLSKDNFDYFEIGDSSQIKIGDKVILIAYPNYESGNTANVQRAHISGKKKFLGGMLYTVDKNVFHGASGGVVLNDEYKVIGLIKGGVESLEESTTNINQGFVPIHLVVEDMDK